MLGFQRSLEAMLTSARISLATCQGTRSVLRAVGRRASKGSGFQVIERRVWRRRVDTIATEEHCTYSQKARKIQNIAEPPDPDSLLFELSRRQVMILLFTRQSVRCLLVQLFSSSKTMAETYIPQFRQPQVTNIDELVRAASKRYGVSSKDLDVRSQISSLSTSCALIPATPLAARRASAPFIGTDAIFLLLCET